MRGGALSCHDSRRIGAGQAGAQREEKPAGTAVRKAPAPRCTGDENRKNGGTYPTGHRGIEQLDLYYSSYLPQFFYAMLSPLLLFGICVFINWRVAAVLLACVPLIPVSIVAVSRFAKRIFAKYWGKYTAMGDVFLDSVQGLKELKLFRADARRQAYMNENAEEFRKITMKVLVMQLASVTIMDLVAFGGAGIGAALAVAGTQNGGGIAAALFLVLVAAEFFLPLRAFGSAFHVAMNGVSAGRMMLTLLEEPEPAWGEAQPCGGRLELEDVHFSYAPGRETLHGVSVVFPDRGMTAIVGESGCGKTTAAKLLTGALRPGSGRVLLDGKPVESLDRQAYYASLAHVSCETFLFHDTIRANFLLANPHAAEEEMWRALALVRLDGLVRERGGLDFVLNEDAADISGGQKQRLALAVNLTAPKRIYIFDEATGNIDAESEGIIMEVIRSLSTFAGVTVITHRLANVAAADSILYMEDGRICEQGDHASLMARGGHYAALFCAQRELEQGYLELIKEAQA